MCDLCSGYRTVRPCPVCSEDMHPVAIEKQTPKAVEGLFDVVDGSSDTVIATLPLLNLAWECAKEGFEIETYPDPDPDFVIHRGDDLEPLYVIEQHQDTMDLFERAI